MLVILLSLLAKTPQVRHYYCLTGRQVAHVGQCSSSPLLQSMTKEQLSPWLTIQGVGESTDSSTLASVARLSLIHH
jgi:hypothetical protein